MAFGNLKPADNSPFSHLFVVYEWHGEQDIFLLTSPLIPVLRERLFDRLAPLEHIHVNEAHSTRMLHIDGVVVMVYDGVFDAFNLVGNRIYAYSSDAEKCGVTGELPTGRPAVRKTTSCEISALL